MLDEIQAETRAGLGETRRALAALRASPIEDLGLPAALATLAQDAANRANLTLELETPEALDDLPLEVEQTFFRVAQEALANAGQHARAERLEVRLRRRNTNLTLLIRDDGEGFPTDRPSDSGRFGLRGMRERAEMIDADLTIDSQPGRGTTVEMTWEAQP
jgi:two-component system sensor histidine kinase UhpB